MVESKEAIGVKNSNRSRCCNAKGVSVFLCAFGSSTSRVSGFVSLRGDWSVC